MMHAKLPRRLWLYQRERFPLFAHGVLLIVFSQCAVFYSAFLRGGSYIPAPQTCITAFLLTYFGFLQLRILDEFKDSEDDRRFRPYRPVPRGLVSLSELAVVGMITAALQFAVAAASSSTLLLILLTTWLYQTLMTREFFVAEWLSHHPVAYLLSHMLILPMFALLASASDWGLSGTAPPAGLLPLITTSFAFGLVFEIGRKIRAQADEERGVETNSVLWGRKTAVYVWWCAMTLALLCAAWTAIPLQHLVPVNILLLLVFGISILAGLRFLRTPKPGAGRDLEHVSGLALLMTFSAIGWVSVSSSLL
jgi:4-hydroxybenzoate polyprenyltransferase